MWSLKNKSTLDELDLRVASLLNDAIAKFAKDQSLQSMPSIKRVDIHREKYTKRGKEFLRADVRGFMLHNETVVRFWTVVYSDLSSRFWLEKSIWIDFYEIKGLIYPLAGDPKGQCGIGSWDRHPIAFQHNNQTVSFIETFAAASKK